jgi:hypothetical protein
MDEQTAKEDPIVLAAQAAFAVRIRDSKDVSENTKNARANREIIVPFHRQEAVHAKIDVLDPETKNSLLGLTPKLIGGDVVSDA